MKPSKILIVIIVLAIGGYIASKYLQNDSSSINKNSPWYKALDKNGDGKLSIEELKILDANGDGIVSKEEANQYQVPPEELKRWDKDGDGSISQKELDTCGC